MRFGLIAAGLFTLGLPAIGSADVGGEGAVKTDAPAEVIVAGTAPCLDGVVVALGHFAMPAQPIGAAPEISSFGELDAWLGEIAKDHRDAKLLLMVEASGGELSLTAFDLEKKQKLRAGHAPLVRCEDRARLARLTHGFIEELEKGRAEVAAPPCCDTATVTTQVARDEAPPPLHVLFELKLSLSQRTLRFASTGPFRDHEMELVPTPGLAFSAYPFSMFDKSWARSLGVSVAYVTTLGLSTLSPVDGVRFPTRFDDVGVGLHYRFELGERWHIVPEVVFRRTAFSLGVAEGGQRETTIPSVAYLSLVPRVSADFALTKRIGLFFGAGYHFVASSGADFAASETRGLDLAAGTDLTISGPFSVRIGAEYVAYFVSLDPGEATDAILSISTSVRVSL